MATGTAPDGQPTSARPLLTHDEAVERARALAPALRERAAQTEASRQLPDDSLRDLLDAGLFRLLQPARFGGAELDMHTFLELGTELGRGDASTAWVWTVLEGHYWFMGLFPEQAQRDVWGERPETFIATAVAPAGEVPRPVEGGYRVRGRWPFSSGCDLADWVVLGGLVPPAHEGEPPVPHYFLLPRQDYTLVDDWYTLGMRGTGSKSIVVADAFVPAHRTVKVQELLDGRAPGRTTNPGPLYRIPLLSAWPLTFMGPTLGAALGAYETWRESIQKRHKAFAGVMQSESVAAQLRLAESYAEIDAARTLIRRDVDELMRAVRAGEELTLLQRARIRLDHCYVVKLCTDAVNRLFAASGGSSIYDGHPLQRYWRDVHAGGHHRALDWDDAAETFGRLELGLETRGLF